MLHWSVNIHTDLSDPTVIRRSSADGSLPPLSLLPPPFSSIASHYSALPSSRALRARTSACVLVCAGGICAFLSPQTATRLSCMSESVGGSHGAKRGKHLLCKPLTGRQEGFTVYLLNWIQSVCTAQHRGTRVAGFFFLSQVYLEDKITNISFYPGGLCKLHRCDTLQSGQEIVKMPF